VARRWKILIVVGLFVALTDQWTKFLAVRNLTPGIARAHFGDRPDASLNATDAASALASVGVGAQLAHFYGRVKGPCSPPVSRASCPTVAVVNGFWNWRYVENPGAAWGLLSGASESVRVPFFLLVSVAAIAFIVTFFRKLPDNQLLLIVSLSLVFGGAIGNFIDRLHHNYVIDFIDWYVGPNHWPTFNFADAAITTGVALLVIQWIRDWAAGRTQAAESASAEPSAD
jgi:signal peptidase II